MQQQITPCLWFDAQAQEAANFYCSQFANAKIVSQSPIVTEIEVSGQRMILLEGGPKYKPNPSISFFYLSEDAGEIDRIWEAMINDGGQVLMALDKYPWSEKYGWINDKYGISWQLSVGKMSDVGQKITPSLLFVGEQYGRAEEAIEQYSSIFKDVKLDGIMRYGDNEQPDQAGKVKHAQVAFNGNKFMFMDSAHAHKFQFSEGVSFTIYCDTQEEIDYYWDRLTENGSESMCGWLKDKFGVSWQIVPSIIGKLMTDPAKAGKAAKAFMEMRKFDIEKLVQATLA
ncbi:VOC family protein [Polluticoccus soli]|uniref:VOC family protein n=1 Tax=Polluticoccus soli TaxID=3034150 RepID=UPI0023E33796|nr:VOC family protein [Flavipsychrobacter sp. JY13-12]